MTLLIGPAVPVPVPQVVLDALTSVQVTTTAGQNSGFQLTFSLSNRSPLQTLFLLTGGSPIPLLRVVIIATINGTPQVLMDGFMTDHHISPGSDSGHSTLTVSGEDLSVIMKYLDFTGFPFPAMPAEARVATILAKYAMFGLIPVIIPSIMIDIPVPIDKIPRQQGTDYDYVKKLADDVGYVFYINPGPVPGTNTAYWGPTIRVGVPQPALNYDMDSYTNVESLSFTYSGDQKALPYVWIQNSETNIPIPLILPDVNPLSPPLGFVEPVPKRFYEIEGTAKLTPLQAILIGLAKAADTADVVKGTGSLDVLRYGAPLQARQLVGVRGVGLAFDGLYYVTSVTHHMKRGEYKQDFSLARNGLISTVPVVPA
jgi:hypothetical protein